MKWRVLIAFVCVWGLFTLFSLSYLTQDPDPECHADVSDLHLYCQMYYLTNINVQQIICGEQITVQFETTGEHPGMTVQEYERRTTHSVLRVDAGWALLTRTGTIRKTSENLRPTRKVVNVEDLQTSTRQVSENLRPTRSVTLTTPNLEAELRTNPTWLSIVTRCPYHKSDSSRVQEIMNTLKHNMNHVSRPNMHMLCTQEENDAFVDQLNGVNITIMDHASTYEDLFNVASTIDGIKMIVNSDISLHKGIELIPDIINDNNVIALSRHASDEMCFTHNRTQSPGNNQCLHYIGSHDAFIFSGKISTSSFSGIFPQYWGSESVVLYELAKTRKILNPCFQIKTYHQHCVAYFTDSKKQAPRVNNVRSRTVRPSYLNVKPTLYVMGTTKNNGNTVQHTLQTILKLQENFNIQGAIFYDDSTDNTVANLRQWGIHTEIITAKNVEGSRTERIAQGRNELIAALSKIWKGDYMLMIDMDGVNNELTGVDKCLTLPNDWGGCCANQNEAYYDLWALRTYDDWCNCDVWQDEHCKIGNKYRKIPQTTRPIKVKSCFGGATLYNWKQYAPQFKQAVYNGKTCEHVSFHQSAGVPMYIQPKMLNKAPSEHLRHASAIVVYQEKHMLRPFTHKKPIFLSKKDEEIFMMQPENTVSMKSDWVKEWSYNNCYEEGHVQYYAILKGGEGWSFQHWFDNLYPRIWQINQENKNVIAVVDLPRDPILYELWAALGFTELGEKVPDGKEMKTCVYPKNSQIRAHPDMIHDLRSVLAVDNNAGKKVVWIHRSKHSTHNGGRFVTNEIELKNAVQSAGFKFVSFSGTDSLTEALQTFHNVYAIVGAHGGGLYNQYFASNSTKIIELMPVKQSGLLHSQNTVSQIPRLAHRCIWHNANLIGQPYIRIHVETQSIQQFKVPVDKIMQAIWRA